MAGSVDCREGAHSINAKTISQIYDTLNDITLCKYDDAPTFLRDSPYIIHGYRPMLSVKQCLKSTFLLTNETVNIWSHLIGFLLCFLLTVHRLLFIPDVPIIDNLMLIFGLFCFQACMLLSACYHIFKCHSFEYYQRWLNIDLFGIFFGCAGCALPSIHMGFYCFESWYMIYMSIAISCLLYLIGWLIHTTELCVLFYTPLRLLSFLSIASEDSSDMIGSGSFRSESSRTCIACPLVTYSGFVMVSILPVLHWAYLCGGYNNAPEVFLPKILIWYLVLLAAFIFYITKFPECCLPGRFDIIGASHQLWHILVVVVFLWNHHICSLLAFYIHRTDCFANVKTLATVGCKDCNRVEEA